MNSVNGISIRDDRWFYVTKEGNEHNMGPADQEVVNYFGRPVGMTVQEAVEGNRNAWVDEDTRTVYWGRDRSNTWELVSLIPQ
jgi:hypothetical protein